MNAPLPSAPHVHQLPPTGCGEWCCQACGKSVPPDLRMKARATWADLTPPNAGNVTSLFDREREARRRS
jgi:hypothetical protein